MAQNYLYMLEFAVQELIITQGNECAPPEYPLNAEFTFRTGVYVSIPEEDFGSVKDESCLDELLCSPPKLKLTDEKDKNAQCCLFALEKPVGENENLMVHIYKKRTEKCKFLIGCAEYRMKEMFDKVMDKFNAVNGNGKVSGVKRNGNKKNGNGKSNGDKKNGAPGEKRLSGGQVEVAEDEDEAGAGTPKRAGAARANPQGELTVPATTPVEELHKTTLNSNGKLQSDNSLADADGDRSGALYDKSGRYKTKTRSEIAVARGKLDPTHKHVDVPKRDTPVSEVQKMGLPLYSIEGKVTGSMVLLIRLSCMGTNVYTSIPYSKQPHIASALKPVCYPECRPPGRQICADTCFARIRSCELTGEDACSRSSSGSKSIHQPYLIYDLFK